MVFILIYETNNTYSQTIVLKNLIQHSISSYLKDNDGVYVTLMMITRAGK